MSDEYSNLRDRIERLENQQSVMRTVFEKVYAKLESLVRDLGLVADLAELRELRRSATIEIPSELALSRKTALELGEKLERIEGAARTAHTSVRGLRTRKITKGEP